MATAAERVESVELASPKGSSRLAEALANPYVHLGQLVFIGTIALVVATKILWPAPIGILFSGAVLGSLSALMAMGLVLTYRANKIINFAIGELGAVAGLLGGLLFQTRGYNFFICVGAGLVAALAVGAIVEFLVIRRFATAPRLILTVATIGIAGILSFVELALPSAFGESFAAQDFVPPFTISFRLGGQIFQAGHVLAIVSVIVIAIALSAFFRFSRFGVAMRAAAESSERSLQLGIPIKRIGTMVWVMAAGLSATASLLRAPILGVPIGQVLGPKLLLRALAAAVIARMENLSVAFGAAVVLGVLDQSIYWATGRDSVSDGVLFFVIMGALLLQRRGKVSRADESGTSSWDLVKEVRPIPKELRSTPEIRYWMPQLGVAAAALALTVPLFLRTSEANLVSYGLILAMIGISLVVLTGWAGEISLGQMAFVGFGSATAAKLATLEWSFFVVLLAAGLVGAGVAVLIGLPSLRIRGPFLAVTTFAFALATSSYFLNAQEFGSLIVDDRLRRPTIFGKFRLESEHTYLYFVLVLLVLVTLSARAIRASRIGRVLIASRDNPRTAASYGVSVVRARLVAFAFSGFFAALAGALFAFHQRGVSTTAFLPNESLRIFVIVVFGGLGSIPGVILGAAYFVFVDYFFPLQSIRFLFSGVGLLFVLLVIPGGLSKLMYNGRDALLRGIAKRRGILVPSLLADKRVEKDAMPVALAAAPAPAIEADG